MRLALWGAFALVAVALGAGAAFGASDVVDLSHEERTAALPSGEATYYLCPGEDAPLGVLHGGDRVWATGRDEQGTWIAVRAPEDLEARVWIRGGELELDAGVDGIAQLPVAACDVTLTTPATAGGVTTPGTDKPSTTGPPGTAGSTTEPSSFPSTTGPPTSAPTTAFPSTTGPPDTDPPQISGLSANPARIWEDGASCVRLPRQTTVTVSVTDASSAITDVTLHWSIGDVEGDVAMTGPRAARTATLGPFPPGTVEEGGDAVLLSVTAADAAGNTATTESHRLLRLEACAP